MTPWNGRLAALGGMGEGARSYMGIAVSGIPR